MSRLADLIFDLDDTLICSFEGYVKAHQHSARLLGWPVLSEPELVAYERDFPSTLARQYPGRDVQPFIDAWHTIAHHYPYQAIDGAVAALTALRGRGHRLWIVTSRGRSNLGLRLEQGGWEPAWFHGIFAREDQPEQKPSPRAFEPVWQARERRGLGKRPACYFGDRGGDRAAATAAGVKFVAVLTGPEAAAGFPGTDPGGHVLASVAGSLEWVEQWLNSKDEPPQGEGLVAAWGFLPSAANFV